MICTLPGCHASRARFSAQGCGEFRPPVRGDFTEDILGQGCALSAAVLFVYSLAFDNADAPLLARRNDRFENPVDGQGAAPSITRLISPFLTRRTTSSTTSHSPRLAVRAPPEAIFHHILQEHLAAGTGHQVDVFLYR